MIHFQEINPDNWRMPIKVKPDQERFVASVATTLARAYAYRHFSSTAGWIFHHNTRLVCSYTITLLT